MGPTWGLRPPEEGGVPHGGRRVCCFSGQWAAGKAWGMWPQPPRGWSGRPQALGSRERRGPLASALPHIDRPAAQRHGLDPLSRQKAGDSGISLGDTVVTGVY